MKTKTTILRAATLAVALLAGLAGTATAGADGPPVIPVFHWDADARQVIVTPPDPVILWMRGEIDDPDGALASWKARYDRQRETPGFAWAVLALQDLAREAADGGATPFQVEHEVIPRILEQRGDIREGLYGNRDSSTMARKCFEVVTGTLTCKNEDRFPWEPCEIDCPSSDDWECTKVTEIPCPDKDLQFQLDGRAD